MLRATMPSGCGRRSSGDGMASVVGGVAGNDRDDFGVGAQGIAYDKPALLRKASARTLSARVLRLRYALLRMMRCATRPPFSQGRAKRLTRTGIKSAHGRMGVSFSSEHIPVEC
jgi:hypothetical protein